MLRSDEVTQKTNFLLLVDTNMQKDQLCEIPNLNCIVQLSENDVRSGEVAINHNNGDKVNFFTTNGRNYKKY